MMTAEVKGSTPDPTMISKRIEWKGKSVFKSDWSLLDRTLTKKYKAQNPAITQQLVYVHGDSKVKQKWKSEWLTLADKALQITTDPPYHKPGTPQKDYDKTHGVKHDRVKPLSQIATYCRYGETRYGYIITQTELVALRIRLFGAYTPANPTRAAIEYKSVPWSASGNQLTVNLAIWALGCMGMNDTHRPLEGPNHTPLAGMARLTWWKKATRKNEEGYVNVISQRFVSAKEWPAFSKGKKVYLDNDPNATSKTAKFLSAEDRVPKDSRTTSSNDLAKAVKDLSLDDKKKSSTASGGASASSSSSSAKTYTKCVVNKKEYKLKVDKGKYQVSLDNGKNWYPVEQDNKKAWFVKTAPKPTPISQMI
ncbi:hypothetical protein B0T21DRAFT_339397 [Apiosordaria backusii]|uniref:Uncharacterized protein n=1 Tax=Apiosordaria backusii TaxID=314023 RepID=A0AA40DU87_9PEZI|nr:hypothetical protein B0T21DRAFT_339397 [Apiosordaria backusii]